MNAHKHAELSVKRRGGSIEDYYPIHFFMDSTKELCSDNRHRILHNLWGIRRVVIPIFGASIINSDGKTINVKDVCEQDHILPDYRNRFIPTLADFVDAVQEDQLDLNGLERVLKYYEDDPEMTQLLLSPLALTGQIKSLLITHNSWFLNAVVPRVLERKATIRTFEFAPEDLFSNMAFRTWMDNGQGIPRSAKNIDKIVSTGIIQN